MEQLPAAAYQLGTPSSIHRRSRRAMTALGGLAIGLVIFGALGLVGGAASGDLAAVVFGVLCAAAGAAAGWAGWLRHLKRCVVVAPQGLVDIDGATVALYPWDAVQEVYQNRIQHYINFRRAYRTERYSIRLRDGRRLNVDETLTDIPTLGQAMQQQVTQRLLPQAVAHFNAGEALSFGAFRLNQAGVSKATKTYPWSQIGGLRFERGYVQLTRRDARGALAQALVAKTPNIFVLQALVDQVVQQGAPATAPAPVVPVPPEPAPAPQPPQLVLRAEGGPDSGRTFTVDAGGALLGRGQEATLRIADQQLSRHHARIDFAKDRFWLSDLQSANGTWLNGMAVSAPAPLRPDDLIAAGQTSLRVVALQPRPAPVLDPTPTARPAAP